MKTTTLTTGLFALAISAAAGCAPVGDDGAGTASAVDEITLERDTSPTANPGLNFPPLTTCATVAPHASLTLGAWVASATSTSPDTSYASTGCGRYVVDVAVGPDANQAPNFYAPTFDVWGDDQSGGFWLSGVTQAQCADYRQYVRIYRRNPGETAFTAIGGGTLVGQWVTSGGLFGPHCTGVPASGWTPVPTLTPPASGAPVVYRVAVRARLLNGADRRVSAGASHTSQPW